MQTDLIWIIQKWLVAPSDLPRLTPEGSFNVFLKSPAAQYPPSPEIKSAYIAVPASMLKDSSRQ
ncbi:hypothetical protein RE428_10560 [Marinobacter nanhaiticus D15-8W]|nr:hypothetical protein RE428_10560 [Marinobacter nanhaiticus D15-8W]